MRNSYNSLIFLVLSMSLISCGATVHTSTSKTTEIYGSGVIQKPVIVDLDVKDTKISGNAMSNDATNVEIVKQQAVVDALKNSNSDVLVEPNFQTTTYGTKTTAIVVGFPATYKNFRSIKQEDLLLLQAGITQKANVYSVPVTENKRKGTWTILAGTIALGGLLGLAIGLAVK